jgi:hypothetical protein
MSDGYIATLGVPQPGASTSILKRPGVLLWIILLKPENVVDRVNRQLHDVFHFVLGDV